jgi:cytochrome c-type biogenesis protein CcmH/NrfG
MAANRDMIAALREALRASPDNLPLRRHLAETLMSLGQAESAETEYREALQLAPNAWPGRSSSRRSSVTRWSSSRSC